MKRFYVTILLFSLLSLLFQGCKSSVRPTPVLALRSPHIRGEIIQITYSQGVDSPQITGILVKGDKETDTQYAKAIISITDETRIFLKEDDDYILATPDHLQTGQIVEVLFIGQVLLSDPVQAVADEIVIRVVPE